MNGTPLPTFVIGLIAFVAWLLISHRLWQRHQRRYPTAGQQPGDVSYLAGGLGGGCALWLLDVLVIGALLLATGAVIFVF